MTRQDKELLIQDLCARLPYGVKVQEYGEIYSANLHNISGIVTTIRTYKEHPDRVKPILFPMSAINEVIEVCGKEVNVRDIINSFFENGLFVDSEGDICIENADVDYVSLHKYNIILDTFHRYHIDYRDLIGKGLAISVFDLPENPYK